MLLLYTCMLCLRQPLSPPLSPSHSVERSTSPVAPRYSPLPTVSEMAFSQKKTSNCNLSTEETANGCSFCWFKLYGDNIDKNIKRRHVHSDRQIISIHYFHSYAVKDRIDSSSFSDNQPQHVPRSCFRGVIESSILSRKS